MNAEKWFREQLDQFKDDVEFQTEKVILDFTEQVVAYMGKQNMSRVDLAKRLGVSKAFVTKLLNGNPNLTIKTMVSISKTLGCDLNIDICPADFEVKKFYTTPQKQSFSVEQFTEEYKPIPGGETNAIAA
jgi:transcriptional regulator with XRE-family HTH domain